MFAAPAQHGFSLLEVLVGLAIAALALGVLFQIFGQGATALTLGQEYAQAVSLAESELAAMVTEEGMRPTVGRFADKFDWRVTVSDAALPAGMTPVPALPLRQATVEVRWISRGTPRSIELITLRPAAVP